MVRPFLGTMMPSVIMDLFHLENLHWAPNRLWWWFLTNLPQIREKFMFGCKVNYMRGIPIMHESLLKCREWRFHLPKSNFGNPHAVTDLWVNSEVDGNIEITGFYFGTRPYGSPQSRFEPLIMFRMTSKTDGRSKISGWFLVFFGIFAKSLIMIFGLLWALFAKSERWL